MNTANQQQHQTRPDHRNPKTGNVGNTGLPPVRSKTASGQEASYGNDRGTIWLSFSHCRNRHNAIYATPNWKEGLARIRERIRKHGIKTHPEHREMFGFNPDEKLPAIETRKKQEARGNQGKKHPGIKRKPASHPKKLGPIQAIRMLAETRIKNPIQIAA